MYSVVRKVLGTPRYLSPAFFAGMVHTAISSLNINGECSAGPSVASKMMKSSTTHLYQVFH